MRLKHSLTWKTPKVIYNNKSNWHSMWHIIPFWRNIFWAKNQTLHSCSSTFIRIAHHLSIYVECELYDTNLHLSQIGTDVPAKGIFVFQAKKGRPAVSLWSNIEGWGSRGCIILQGTWNVEDPLVSRIGAQGRMKYVAF